MRRALKNDPKMFSSELLSAPQGLFATQKNPDFLPNLIKINKKAKGLAYD
jgi:hypothetical protein